MPELSPLIKSPSYLSAADDAPTSLRADGMDGIGEKKSSLRHRRRGPRWVLRDRGRGERGDPTPRQSATNPSLSFTLSLPLSLSTYACTRTHTRTCPHAHAQAHVHTRTDTHTRTPTHMHKHACANTHGSTEARKHTVTGSCLLRLLRRSALALVTCIQLQLSLARSLAPSSALSLSLSLSCCQREPGSLPPEVILPIRN